MTARSLPWRIEEVCFNAFPAPRQVLYGNWLLRFADGMSRRANSANPLRPRCAGLAATIVAAEALYQAQGLPTIFRVPSLVVRTLDRALAARGYAREGETCVLCGPPDALVQAADRTVRMLDRPDAEWLAAMTAWQGYTPAQSAAYARILAAIAVPARFALLAADGAPAALAYGALHDGLLCYESVITHPGRRRQGLARRVLGAIAVWGREAGAAGACLQVAADNAAGRALYAGLGLEELYRYHYRREPSRT